MVLLSQTLVIWSLMCGKVVPCYGTLVVKDPLGTAPSVPGIFGMTVIRWCFESFLALELPAVAQAPSPVIETLQKCHQVSDRPLKTPTDTVRVHGTQTVRIPVLAFVLLCCLSHLSLACQLGCSHPHILSRSSEVQPIFR